MDLTAADLIPADAVMFIAAHKSRAVTLTEWLDASVLDELDPDAREPELDIYNLENANQPPFTEAFLSRYRDAQIARNRKITAWVREMLEDLQAALRTAHQETLEQNRFFINDALAQHRSLIVEQEASLKKMFIHVIEARADLVQLVNRRVRGVGSESPLVGNPAQEIAPATSCRPGFMPG